MWPGLGRKILAVLILSLTIASVCLAQKTLTVPDDYPTIQAAIDAASEGAIISIAEGTWSENITIDKSLTLRGARQSGTLIKGRGIGWEPVVWVVSSSSIKVRLEDVKITDGNHGLWVQGTLEIYLNNVVVEQSRGDGITIWESAYATIVDSTITTSHHCGLIIQDSAQVSIMNSTIEHSGESGIHASDSTHIDGSAMTVADNKVYGLLLEDELQASITSSSIVRNEGAIGMEGSTRLLITGSTISGYRFGIGMHGSAAITARDCTISSSGIGIGIGDAAHAVIANAVIEGGKTGGVYLESTAEADITDSTIAGKHSFNGITLVDSSDASIMHSVIADQWRYGISASDKAIVSITDSTIDGNTFGVVLSGSAHASLIRNEIAGNRQYGVTLQEPPCFEVDDFFTGYVAGRLNVIPSLLDLGGNLGGDFCSALFLELEFLISPRGGVLDRTQ